MVATASQRQFHESLRPFSVGLLDLSGWLRKAEAGCCLPPCPLPAAPFPLAARGGQCFRLLPALRRAIEADGGRNASQPVIKQPVATLLLFQAGSNAMGRSSCITSLPSRSALASFINVRLLGTAGAGSCKFTVCMDNVAQTQHVWNGLVCSLEFCRTSKKLGNTSAP